jgi:hypothetical protein
VQHFEETIAPSSKDAPLKQRIRTCLSEYYDSDVLQHPARDRRMDFLIAAKEKEKPGVTLWRTNMRRTFLVPKYDVAGYDAPVYRHLAKRYWRDDLSMNATVVLAVALLALVKATNTKVGGPSQVLVVTEKGAFEEPSDYVAAIEERATEFQQYTDELFLLCADLSAEDAIFDNLFSQYIELLRTIRSKHTWMMRAFLIEVGHNWRGDPYPKVHKKTGDRIIYPDAIQTLASLLEAGRKQRESKTKSSASQKSEPEP